MTIAVETDWWKTLFDEIYLTTDARSVCDEELTRREVDLFCELIPFRAHDCILDLCGGQGRHAVELCRRGIGRCTVFDYSQALLRIGAQEACTADCDVAFVQGDARSLQFDAESFQHVLILGNSLGYVADDKADVQILREVRRVLAPGGWLLVDVTDGDYLREHFTPNAWHEIEADVVVCRQREMHADRVCAREMVLSKQRGLVRDRNYAIRLFDAETLTDLALRAGLDDIRLHRNFKPSRRDEDTGFMNHRMVMTARR